MLRVAEIEFGMENTIGITLETGVRVQSAILHVCPKYALLSVSDSAFLFSVHFVKFVFVMSACEHSFWVTAQFLLDYLSYIYFFFSLSFFLIFQYHQTWTRFHIQISSSIMNKWNSHTHSAVVLI